MSYNILSSVTQSMRSLSPIRERRWHHHSLKSNSKDITAGTRAQSRNFGPAERPRPQSCCIGSGRHRHSRPCMRAQVCAIRLKCFTMPSLNLAKFQVVAEVHKIACLSPHLLLICSAQSVLPCGLAALQVSWVQVPGCLGQAQSVRIDCRPP